mmetsp:Transcript_46957/g.98514  ORF Transcript_46957/g.98514 Transcript_46957/m.98514 type:complete len:531 (+) Transcript_46957:135-1727(+)|eukprot:CAMPEP_0183726916 /NCGR_PEP_ID=MMETSP0737-20130205/24391_1 /TAXON_ID=385413 /ORGANISM="Thalassiosira miniscula, Strain CCMP1093" /LENGTH=530 /DNA_ID=CAMNT_0025958387 /DNA_START=33 /DNA_END=1625 /DNA_ORIENTATION=+
MNMKLSAILLVAGFHGSAAFVPSPQSQVTRSFARSPTTLGAMLKFGKDSPEASLPKTVIPGDAKDRPIVIGAGVSGAASAIALKDCGYDPVILEHRSEQSLLGGAGINLQTKAIEALNSFGVDTEKLIGMGRRIKTQAYYTPDGRLVSSLDKAGTDDMPAQIGIHRGQLGKVILDQARARDIPTLMKHHVSTIDQVSDPDKVFVKTEVRGSIAPSVIEGNMVLGSDGINSIVRKYYITGNRDTDPQRWHGATHYRGVAKGFPGFLDKETMILAGGIAGTKAVVYPITNPDENGLQDVNWVLAVEENEINEDPDTYQEHCKERLKAAGFDLPFLDVFALIDGTERFMAWPMVDLDPLDTWTDARCALSGDAAHGMLPVGSGGAMAALLDAISLREAFQMEKEGSIPQKLRKYEDIRYKAASLHQGKCRLQPAENIVQEAMDAHPTGEIPAEYGDRIREVMKNIHNPSSSDPPAEVILTMGVSKGIISEEQLELLTNLFSDDKTTALDTSEFKELAEEISAATADSKKVQEA